MGCISSEQLKKNQESFLKLAESFEKRLKDKFGNQYDAYATDMFMRIVETTRDATVGYKGFDYGIPTVEHLKTMDKVINRELALMGKSRSAFAKWLYLPNEIFKDVSFVHKWYQDVQKSNEAYKGQTSYFNSQMQDIVRDLKLASAKEGFKFHKIEKKLVRRMKKYNDMRVKALAKNDSNGFRRAEEYYREKIDAFTTEKEGKILSDFHKLASAKESEFIRMKGKYDSNLYNAAKTYRVKIQKPAQKLMIQGIENYKWSLKRNASVLKNFENYQSTLNRLDALIKKFKDGNLQRDGYFPVLSFDIMPSLSEASNHLLTPKGKGEKQQADFQKGVNIIEKLENVLNDNVYINKHLKEKSKINGYIDYNVLPIMHSFVKSAARFNYVAYNAGKYIDVMKDLNKTLTDPNSKQIVTQLDKKLAFLEGYITDHYGIITGDYVNKNKMGANVARTITAYQFMSKLGLNIRGAVRNSTQSLFNYVWFGHQAMWDVKAMKKNPDMVIRMKQGLANNGVLFPEIQEIFGKLPFETVMDKGTGTYRIKTDLSTGERLQAALEKVAETSGKPMQYVENSINRRFTFEYAYGLKWQLDKSDPYFIGKFEKNLAKELKRKNRKETVEDLKKQEERDFQIFEKNDATEYDFRLEMYRRRKAENHANAVVNTLHFDYSMTGKSKILVNPLGSVAGQFQHYGLSFFNLQRKIIRDGKDSVFTNQWNTNAAWRMYRLGLLYAGVNGLFAPLLNANLGNLIQNDTYERLKNYHDAILGGDEEKQRAFFGKGPIIGTFGGPFISDLVTIGNLSGLYEMEEGSVQSYLAGYQDMAEESGSEKGKEIVRLLNTSAYRFMFNTLPKWKQGTNLGVLIQGELGLFPTKEIRKRRKQMGLDAKTAKKSKPKTRGVDYQADILKSLDAF